jgi:hypothetical protein
MATSDFKSEEIQLQDTFTTTSPSDEKAGVITATSIRTSNSSISLPQGGYKLYRRRFVGILGLVCASSLGY